VKSFDEVVYVHQANAGPAAARNAGYRAAHGAFICFTDSDCVPDREWVERLLSGFKDKETAVISGTYGIANPQHRLARGVHAEICYRHQKRMPDYPKAFGSYNFCIRRTALEAVGGFDVCYRQASGEDNDLSYRLLKSGYRIFFCREARVAHHHPVSLRKYLKEQFRHGFWRAKMYFDHPDMAAGDDYTFWKDSAEVALVTLSTLLIPVSIALSGAWMYGMLGQMLFVLFELIFSLVMGLNKRDGLYFAIVMWLRSYARTVGIAIGIARVISNYLFVTTRSKKVKKNLLGISAMLI
jgi:GT2 family glycosyltransferase